MRSVSYLSLLLSTMLAPGGRAQSQDPAIVIRHVTVIDVVEGRARPGMAVVIRGNRITQVAPDSDSLTGSGSTEIDATGRFLMPGLWNMHVHLGNATEAVLPYLISFGITGVRDMGSPSFDTLRRWRIEALTGKRIGPRIVAPGPILTMASPDFWQQRIHDPADARSAVDRLAQQGVDFIKITQTLDRETYFAVAEECRMLNLPLAGHLPVNDDGNGFKVSGIEASEAGQKSLEHAHGIPFHFEEKDRALISALLKNGTWVDPTLTTYYARAHVHELAARQDDPRLRHVAPGLRQFWTGQIGDFPNPISKIHEQIFEWRSEGTLELFRAGVPLLAGTDLGFPYVFPGDLHRELELFVQAGIPAPDVLRIATLNAARYLNLDKVLGSVEAGKFADLVLLDGDPLRDIGNTRKVRAVVFNGHYLDRQKLDAIIPSF